MKAETLSRGRPTVSNPMDDTHETHKQLKQEGGATEGLADVLTENFKRLSDQSLQVNENLLSFREEVLDEFTGIHGEIKDIHHNAASNFQKLDAKIDGNYQKLDVKIDGNFQGLDHKIDTNQKKLEADIALVRKELASTNQEGIHTRETLSNSIESTRETLSNSIESTRETLSIQMDAKFAQAQNSMMRWNIGMFIGTVTMFIGLAGLMIALV